MRRESALWWYEVGSLDDAPEYMGQYVREFPENEEMHRSCWSALSEWVRCDKAEYVFLVKESIGLLSNP